MPNDLFIPQGLQPIAQGKKTRVSTSVFATLGPYDNSLFVRGGGVVFRRSAIEDEIIRG